MKITQFGAGVFTLDDYLSGDECARYIEMGGQIGYMPSEIDTETGARRLEQYRNNDRVLLDDTALASRLFERAQPYLPKSFDEWQLSGFNERMRFYRYRGGEYFRWHKDGTFARSADEESFLTFMIYLNEGFSGGNTQFQWDQVVPRTGTALVFPHRHLHQGGAIASGTKYVLRTDVMYARQAAKAR